VSTLNHPGDPIDLPKIESKPDWEVELAIVIGKAAKNVSEAEALDSVLGYTCANDVSGREWQIGASLQPSQRPSAAPAGGRQRPQAAPAGSQAAAAASSPAATRPHLPRAGCCARCYVRPKATL
jgi:2-keto-4-pentenoate hydratase/2-oxohepta-3-ene-1,7-dioic acid hydratase in catechol pathway